MTVFYKTRLFSLAALGILLMLNGSCKKEDDQTNNQNNNTTATMPSVATTAISNRTGISASSGGTVTSDGGATVTARGVCWGPAINPTIANTKTTDGSGTGVFVSNITGLDVGKTYYVRAYATNSVGTAYGSSVLVVTGIGASYEGGIIAYIFQAGDPGFVAGQTHGIIVTPTDVSIGAEWGCSGTLISGANLTALGTGNQNTAAIIAGCSASYTAAKLCDDLSLGGYTDWYLPNIYELGLVRTNKAQIGSFATSYYWSSLQSDATSAHAANFGSGSASAIHIKTTSNYVRAIRVF